MIHEGLSCLDFPLTASPNGVKRRDMNGERKKPINIKNFGGTPPGVRPVCPGDTSHLSRDMSRLSHPFSIDLHINQAQMSQVSLGRPEFVPGTPPGRPTAKFLYLIFLYRFFFLSIMSARKDAFSGNLIRSWRVEVCGRRLTC